MVYPNLKFPKRTNRPFFYTNFIATVDGKVQVLKNPKDYWPIGSKADHEVMMELRSHADCLIHGKNLAKEFGEITLESLNKNSFKKKRKKLGKDPQLPYCVITNHPEAFSASQTWSGNVKIACEKLQKLSRDLHKMGYKNVLVEGGPTLLTSFLQMNLLDEIFLTIAPKIYGNEKGMTLTLAEGYLFPKNSIKKLRLLSVKSLRSELYLHYKVIG